MEQARDVAAQDKMDTTKDTSERGKWNNSLEFMMSCLGFSVGVGSLWKFPHVVMRNGGGAFLIVSAIFLVVCGIPLFFLESCIGQYFSLSPLRFWKMSPLFQGVGISMVLLSTVFSIYYNTLIAWTLYYCAMCFYSTPPWTTCGHEWNTEGCIPIWGANGTRNVNVTSVQIVNFTGERASMLSTEEFWTYNVLDISRGFEYMGTLKWELALAVTASWTIIFICLCKGVFSSRIAVYITAPAPFILLTILLIRASLLPGSLDGVLFYVTPDWEGLKSYQVWLEGFIFGFYSLGNGYGAITTLGSYNKFHDQSLGNAILISISDLLAAVYCGFALFTILGYMAYETGVPVSEIRNSGPGLIFITYPHTASLLPVPQLWTALFFLTCILLGVDSQFGAFKTLTSGLCDLYPGTLGKHKVLVCLVACVGGNLLGLIFITQGGMYYFQVVDWYSAALGTTTISFFEGFAIAWVYGADNFCENIKEMMPTLSNRVLKVLTFHWKYVLPVICMGVLSITLWRFKPPTLNDYTYPDIARTVGWVIAVGIVVPIPAAIFYGLVTTQGSLKQRFKQLSTLRYGSFVKHSCHACKEKSYFCHLPLDKSEMEMCGMLPDVFEDGRA